MQTISPPLPIRSADCPPALALEELAASGRTDGHTAGCASCSVYVEGLRDGRAAFYPRGSPGRTLRRPAGAPPPARALDLARRAAAAGLGAIAVFSVPRAPQVRWKERKLRRTC